MKKSTDYKIALATSLLTFNSLSSCVGTREKIGADMEKKTHNSFLVSCSSDSGIDHTLPSLPNLTMQASCLSITDRAMDDGVPSVVDPMVLNKEIIDYFKRNDFSIETIRSLLNKGLDLKAKSKEGATLLMYVIAHHQEQDNKIAICTYLINKGVDVNAKYKHGITALMLAGWLGIEYLVYMLLEAGANPFTKVNPSIDFTNNIGLEFITECMETEVRPGMTALDMAWIASYYEDSPTKQINKARRVRILKMFQEKQKEWLTD